MVSPLLRPSSSYDELWRQVDYTTLEIPEQFNLGVACADRQDPAARALTVVAKDRSSTDYTFGEVTEQSNRLANALRGRKRVSEIGQREAVGSRSRIH